MENIAQLSDTERKELFAETAIQKNISPAIIEKNFWVCWTLKRIFEHQSCTMKHIALLITHSHQDTHDTITICI